MNWLICKVEAGKITVVGDYKGRSSTRVYVEGNMKMQYFDEGELSESVENFQTCFDHISEVMETLMITSIMLGFCLQISIASGTSTIRSFRKAVRVQS